MKQAFIVTGLGYGDEGKGATTHWLACRHRAHTVVRTGGPQALPHVVTASGSEHTFSQFGSGTLRGSATHLSKHMLIDPNAVLAEGKALKYESGITNVFDLMTMHEDALVITPFQAFAGRVRELLRAANRYGSVGIGVGETVLDSEVLGGDAIRVKDLATRDLQEKLENIQTRKWIEFEQYADRASDLPLSTAVQIREELALMQDPNTVVWALERFGELARRVKAVNTDYVAERILRGDGTVVFEGSQGVLLDRFHGFHPYTTKVRTTPMLARSILDECSYGGITKSLGILRAYHTRHGAGPFVTESAAYSSDLSDAANKTHPWQGHFRVGPFDAVLARYALAACGDGAIDGVVITCLDRIVPRGQWEVCTSYTGPLGSIAGIIPQKNGAVVDLDRQARLGQLLMRARPRIESFDLSAYTERDFGGLCATMLGAMLGTPVMAVSFGPTERDKHVL